MKSTLITIAACCLAFVATATAFADVDFFAPTIDPYAMAPDKLGPPTFTDVKQAILAASATCPDPYDVGAELSDNQVQTGVTQASFVQPPVPPPDPDDTRSNTSSQPSAAANQVANSAGSNSSCGAQSCSSCGSCGSNNDCCGCRPWWVHVDYLALWIQANHLPPLVTTSPDGTPRSDAGVLPGAKILFGDNYVDGGPRNGGRVTLGYWFDDDETCGLRASWFTVGQPTGAANFFANSTGSPTLARPFTSGGVPNAQLAAYTDPTLVNIVAGQPHTPGTIGVTTTSSMDFAEIAFSHVLERGPGGQLGWIAGYRHLEFRENLAILENFISNDPANPNFLPGTALNLVDQFRVANEFEGGQLGTEFTFTRNRWTLDGSARLGLGNVHESVNINGNTVVTDPLGNVSQLPGLLAQPSNDGLHSRNVFAFLPELELDLHCQLTDQIDLTFGYTFLLLTRVARAGDQLDTNVSSTELPTANPTSGVGNQPVEVLRDTSMWAQGISGGVELRF